MADERRDHVLSQVSTTATNALYVAVGFGVLGFQRLQVRRRELSAQVPPEVTDVLRTVGERVGAAVADVRKAVRP